ncbi:MAG: type II CRISPR RNA-guided endonuclease Cas9, partial [Flavobacteriales bacterium]|nr:type II CRISPR RNA-guided endonuclease Cas9 [Flavobacteriales bacterium]
MKKILGLDLGTTSIGWALVNETENSKEASSIIKTGVRIIQMDNFVSTSTGKESKDPLKDFISGNGISPNAGRTLKRGARRSLQRYKLRRIELIKLLKEHNLITGNSILVEEGKDSTHSLWDLRAKAALEKVGLSDFARILLAINKKRGYKSNRKAKGDDEGVAIDGMDVANILYEKQITPGEYVLDLLNHDKKNIPDFYRSDLQDEFDEIWVFQQQFYPDVLKKELKEELKDKKKGHTYKICEAPFELVGVKRDTKGKELKLENYKWRVDGLNQQITLEQLVVVLQEINNQLSNSSGYLGEISDRSKKLIIEKLTVGQYLYEQIKENPHTRLKNQVFYRQDYLNEFNKIWETQAKFHSELTDELKKEISDVVIFYQRRLKSQKGLISVCELEGVERELKDREGNAIINEKGEPKKKIVGPKVIPKSSPLFQEFKIWSILNNLNFTELKKKITHDVSTLDEDLEIRKQMFAVLSVKGKMSSTEILKAVFKKPKDWELANYNEIEGNNTNQVFFKAYKSILELAGYEKVDFNDKNTVSEIFESLGIKKEILDFDAELEDKEFEQQLSYQLWHLLYSYEGDNSNTGNDKLYFHLKEKFGFEKEYANGLVNVTFQDDYGSLSAKAIKKIIPYLKAGNDYSEACALAGYNHSKSLTKEENEKRELKEVLELLPKNSLRNPVVEKILNQMVNVINAIIKEYGKPDEIRIELARELKKSATERADATKGIAKATKLHFEIREKLQAIYPFNTGVRITKNDVLKYKLYNELAKNGYKTIYTNTYID